MMHNNHQGRTITFYSYKGGVGRSLCLVNLAWVMASNGMRVLMVDWDLEAPGLNRYLRPFLPDPDLTSTRGLIDLLNDFKVEALTPGADAPPHWYIDCADVRKYATEIQWGFPSGGRLDLLGAGRLGPDYARSVASFDWRDFYDRFGGGTFLEVVKERMKAEYDYVLIDSRTGVSDLAGVCTVQMPDDLVVCVALNNRSIEGAAGVAAAAARQRQSQFASLRIFPVPTRVELTEVDLYHRALETAKRSFAHLTQHIQNDDAYWRSVLVPYVPYFASNEIPAAFAITHYTDALLEPAARLASYLTDGRVSRHVPVPEDEREKVLKLYQEGTA